MTDRPTLPAEIDAPPGDSAAAPSVPTALPPRYRAVGLLGRGSMGEVWEVHDTLLDRAVAMKVGRSDHEALAGRFAREARVTARLQHPGVLALYDLGRLDDGRAWYTMRLVPDGRTLRAAWREDAPLRARVRPLMALANTLAFAHRHGVAHLDVKPENVLVGAFGETLLLDWGLASDADRSDGGGTPPYAAAEQARGRGAPPSDVYALGVLLHEAAAGHPWVARADGAALPEPLARLRDACLAEAAARPSAAHVAEALAGWLDEVERQRRAAAHLARAEALAPRLAEVRARAAGLREEARARLAGLPPLADADHKAPAWDAEDAARQLETQAAVLEGEWEGALAASIAEAELSEARARLAERYGERLLDAERRGDVDAGRWEALARAHADAAQRRWLDAPARVTLHTWPPDAHVRLFRLEARRRRREPVLVEERRAPLVAVELPAGTWLFELSHPERELVRYPVSVARGEHWDGVRPGADTPLVVELPRRGALGPDDVYVPAGWARLGGDPLALDALPAGRRWIDAFVLRRFPVTAGEWCTWLDALVAAGQDAAALAFQPQDRAGPDQPFRALWRRDADGRFRLGADAQGTPWAPDLPVTLVDAFGAAAFAAAEAARTGLPWRLPDGVELEKAARGADGRPWPWGEGFEPTWACTSESHAGRPSPAAVRAFAGDESPYGVRGLAGNVRAWCRSAWARADGGGAGDLREVRGGSWVATPALCRPACRFAAPPERRVTALGVRLARDWIGER